ncbi:MAG: hypothetical protein U0Q16_39025 [Bryobacteraceae bacterium]
MYRERVALDHLEWFHDDLPVYWTDGREDMFPKPIAARMGRGRVRTSRFVYYINFARVTEHTQLPRWPKFEAKNHPTMVFNNASKVENDPICEQRELDAQGLELLVIVSGTHSTLSSALRPRW